MCRVTPPGKAPETGKVVSATVKQDGRSHEAELRSSSPAFVGDIWEQDIEIMTGAGMKLELELEPD